MQKKLFSLSIVVAITVTLLISQAFVMHMHSTVHHHDDITAYQLLADTDVEDHHRHISQAHSSFDTHINDVNKFSPVEIEVTKEGLSKSYHPLFLFITSFILILLLTPFCTFRVATIIPTKKDLPDKYQLTPELRAPPV